MSILTTQQIRVNNGNFNFPAVNTSLGVANRTQTQVGSGGGCPGEIAAIATGQGTLVDLTTLSIGASGGWAIFINESDTPINWGIDVAAGYQPVGTIAPGDVAGPFQTDAAQTKYRFKSTSGTKNLNVFFFKA